MITLGLNWLGKFLLLGLVYLFYKRELQSKVEDYIELSREKIINERYGLFTSIEPEEVEKKINDLVDQYIYHYALYHFTSRESTYIGQKDADEMIRSITRTLTINISELYIFYIRMVRGLRDDQDLISYIHDIVQERSLVYITEMNKPT